MQGEKTTPMAFIWWVSVSLCISYWGWVSGSGGCLTDGTYNWLRRRATNVSQSSEELMHNNGGLLFRTEGPPLDQIIGQAADIALPSTLSAEGIRIISHTFPGVFPFGSPITFHDVLLPCCCSFAVLFHAILISSAVKIAIKYKKTTQL